MPSASKPQKKTSPLVWVGLAALIVVGYTTLSGGEEGPGPVAPKAKKTRAATKADGLVTEADRTAKFPPLTLASMNVFKPLIKKPAPNVVSVAPPNAAPGGVPANLTGGEGTWYYTGWVELDGHKQALLENPTTGESQYVDAGGDFKKARIGTISVDTVVLIGPDGKSYPVPIQDYGTIPGQAPKVDPVPGGAPLNVPAGALAGAIGVRPIAGAQTMTTATLPDGRTIQVPLDASVAPGTNGNNNGNSGRRRNRNNGNNQGDIYNGP